LKLACLDLLSPIQVDAWLKEGLQSILAALPPVNTPPPDPAANRAL